MPSLTSENNVTVQIQTKADLKGVQQTEAGMKSLGKNTEATAARSIAWGTHIRSAGLIAGVALAGVVKIGSDMVKSFNDSEQVSAQLNAVLTSTGHAAGVTRDQALSLSKAIEHNTAIGDEAVLSAENMLLTFTNIGKSAFPTATQAVADMASAMNGGAVPSAEQMRNQAVLLGKALQDPDAGLGALHRVGVNVDELKKKFTASMPIQEKQKLILKELGSEFGGSAAAALKTHAGQVQHNKEVVDDFKESMGQLIVQALSPFQVVIARILPHLAGFADALSKNKTAIIAIVGAIGGIAMVALVAFVLAIGWIPIAIVAAAATVGAVIAVIASHFRGIKTFVLGVANSIKDAFNTALNFIQDKVNWLKNNWLQAIGFMIGFVATLPFKLPFLMAQAVNKMISIVKSVNWASVFSGIGRAIAGAGEAIWSAISHAFNRVKSLNWGSIMGGIGKGIANGIIDLINGAIKGAFSGVPILKSHVPHIPHFSKGVRNFAGGMAVVGDINGQGGEVVSLPAGSNVYSNSDSKKMLGSTYNHYGDIYLGDAGAVAAYLARIDENNTLAGKGITTRKVLV